VKPALLALAGFLAAAALVASTAHALGETTPDAGMRQHFAEGVRLYDARDYARALSEFQAAYQAKAVPAIERNIALTFERLGRYPEALDALERFVTESGSDLAPAVRDAAQAKMRELGGRVATVRLHVEPPGTPLSVDGAVVGGDRTKGVVHLAPGEHVFSARADGFAPNEVRRTLAAGEETAVDIALSPTAAPPEPAPPLPQPAEQTVVIPPVPPPYEAASPAAARPRRFFLELGAGVGAEQLRLVPTSFGGSGPATDAPRETWGGVDVSFVGGKELSPLVTLIGYAELAGSSMSSSAAVFGSSTPTRWTVGVGDLLLAPGVRLHSRGTRLRLYGDIAGGLDVCWVNANPHDVTVSSVSGGGVGPALLAGAGLELRLPTFYLSAGGALLFHDVSAVKNGSDSLFADSGATRVSLRIAAGLPF
jgi:hypothetical protein